MGYLMKLYHLKLLFRAKCYGRIVFDMLETIWQVAMAYFITISCHSPGETEVNHITS
jgi:hypothetical protein